MSFTETELRKLFYETERGITGQVELSVPYLCAAVHLLIKDLCHLHKWPDPYRSSWGKGNEEGEEENGS